MSNTIKYSESTEQRALNKGNWWIGTGDSNKGPTVESGYWNAINPPDGGYTVYLNKESNGPSIHSITNDENLISFTNKISGNNYTTVAECLVYYQTQDDKLCVNREMENIVTDGLVLNLDAGYAPSYPTSGATWYDLSGNGNDGTLVNGTIFSGGSMVFDGVDDYIRSTTPSDFRMGTSSFTLETVVKQDITTAHVLLEARGNSLVGYLWTLNYGGTGRMSLFYNDNSGGQNVHYQTSDFNVNSTEVYYHLVVKVNRSENNIYFYINGEQAGNTVALQHTNSISPTEGDYYHVGWDKGGVPWNGEIAVFKHYNRALTAAEVQSNYRHYKKRFNI